MFPEEESLRRGSDEEIYTCIHIQRAETDTPGLSYMAI